jgi:hypothetical protein
MRGTEHVHCLIAVANDGIECSDMLNKNNTEHGKQRQRIVKDLIKNVATANLIKKVQIENDTIENENNVQYEESFNFLPDSTYFDDLEDPRRAPFNGSLDYSTVINHTDGTIKYNCPIVQKQSRGLQIANQMHRCVKKTCCKYNHKNDNTCRFAFPVPENACLCNDVMIKVKKDKKNRTKAKAITCRNNAHLNPIYVSALVTAAWGGNVDCQYVYSDSGAAEYAASYASKAEDPDMSNMVKVFIKGMGYIQNPTTRDVIKQAMESVMKSQQVSTVQVCKYLLNLEFVKCSRTFISVNPLPFAKLNKTLITKKVVLQNMIDTDEAIAKGPNSQIGRRRNYHTFVDQQRHIHGECNVTFYSYLSTYGSATVATTAALKKRKNEIPYHNPKLLAPLLTISEISGINYLLSLGTLTNHL